MQDRKKGLNGCFKAPTLEKRGLNVGPSKIYLGRMICVVGGPLSLL